MIQRHRQEHSCSRAIKRLHHEERNALAEEDGEEATWEKNLIFWKLN
jgi:hypothetical protein